MVGTITKQPEELRQAITKVLQAVGGVEEKARIVADHLTDADQCGVQTHGLLTMPSYLKEIADGKLLPERAPEVISDEGNRATVTGNWGFGQCSADFAVRLAIDKARQHGLACTPGGSRRARPRCPHLWRQRVRLLRDLAKLRVDARVDVLEHDDGVGRHLLDGRLEAVVRELRVPVMESQSNTRE